MITRTVVAIIEFCIAHARLVVAAGVALAVICGLYTAENFRLNSDINALLPTNVEWRQTELDFEKAFKRFDLIEVVVQAPTPELADAATAEIERTLASDKPDFQSVINASNSTFFAQHGLLFLPTEELKHTLAGLVEGEPVIHDVAQDRSLRGLVAALEDALLGLNSNRLKLDDFARPLNLVSDSLDTVLAGKPSSFSWRVLTEGNAVTSTETLGFLEVRPVLDYGSVEPGEKAEAAIHRLAAPIASKYQATVRLTGPVAINDEQFGAIKEHSVRNGLITVALVLVILWLALKSGRLIAALVVNLLVGLAATGALGLLMVGAFNVISIYFAVLFVGIGVDFAIQFSVRYRDERYRIGRLPDAIRSAGFHVATPLALAALATAAGFFSFLPTEYRGLSELGMIAGAGMLIAFCSSVTVLPALISLANPPGEPEHLGYTTLAPVDNFLARHRRVIIGGTALVVTCALPSLYWLKFDFNPMDLQNPKSEAIATYLELRRDPSVGANAIEALAPSLAQADAIASRLRSLPEVRSVATLSSFIPADQDAKIPLLRNSATRLADAFDPRGAAPPPTDAENVDALKEGAQRLTEAGDKQTGPGADAARRLSGLMSKLAEAQSDARSRATETLIWPLNVDLQNLHDSLEAQLITEENLPRSLVQDWIAPDGRARISVSPKADPNNLTAMRKFANAISAADPNATEGPITTFAAGDMILFSFIEAGAWALGSIAILLIIVLRRFGDVLLTLIPLCLAGLVTMEIMALIGMSFNFANIIALPLLLGVGVAFKIYYIMAWREGTTHLLQTPLTRAVIFSASTTATAFGSLWLSDHPGTSSMGKLLALSLVCTLAAAVLFQPILMGKPRVSAPEESN